MEEWTPESEVAAGLRLFLEAKQTRHSVVQGRLGQPPCLHDIGQHIRDYRCTDAALALACVLRVGGPDPIGFRRLFGLTGVIDLDTPP